MLRAVLPSDSDFSAFFPDIVPMVAERLASGMDRLAKATLLLELASHADLVAALRQHAPDRLTQHESSRPAVDATKRNPYRGLSAFQLDEAHLFFGREALTTSLWQRCEALHEKPDATLPTALSLASDDRDVIIRALPNPAECLLRRQTLPSHGDSKLDPVYSLGAGTRSEPLRSLS